MKKLLALCVGVVVLCATATAFAFAPDMTGTWTGELKGPDGGGGFQLSFVLKQEGDKLTGSVEGPQGEPIAISNGKVDGDKFSFDVSFNGMTISHSGTFSGDEAKMTTKSSSGEFPESEMTLKRSAPTAAPASAPATVPPAK